MKILKKLFGRSETQAATENPASGSFRQTYLNGEKFSGGFGPTDDVTIEYEALRARSVNLYNDNIYAEGLINRYIINVINTGLMLEATPVASILGITAEEASKWSDSVEARFEMYINEPLLIDYHGQKNLVQIQQQRELQALVEGDVLIIYHINQYGLPQIELVSGGLISSPAAEKVAEGHYLIDGIEFNKKHQEVAYWVQDSDEITWSRVSRFGEKTGRKTANLYRPGKRLQGQHRGIPLLGNVLQSLKEIDRYRDSAQRKALAASFMVMAVEKDSEGVAAQSIGRAVTTGFNAETEENGYKVQLKQFSAGTIIDDMPAGHKIKLMGSEGTDISFGEFEETIISAVAWTKGIPPEVLRMSFGSNYAASKQATSEFNMFLDTERSATSDVNDKPFYKQWLYCEVLKGNIEAKGLLEAWFDLSQYALIGAWTKSEWSGSVKLNADFVKEVDGWNRAIEGGLSTHDMATKALFGRKHDHIIKTLQAENIKKADALAPLAILENNDKIEDAPENKQDKSEDKK